MDISPLQPTQPQSTNPTPPAQPPQQPAAAPQTVPSTPQTTPSPVASTPQPSTTPSSTPKNVLCVEDEPFISDLYRHALLKAGYTVEVVSDGKSGLAAAQSNQFDIILLDIVIPQMQGIDVLHEIKKIPNLKAKIIIATNLEQDEETRAAIEKEADAYIIKAEITPTQLVEFLQNF